MRVIKRRNSVSSLYFSNLIFCLFLSQVEEDADGENMEEDIDGELADIESLNYDDLDNVSKLQKSQRYTDIMQVSFYMFKFEYLSLGAH